MYVGTTLLRDYSRLAAPHVPITFTSTRMRHARLRRATAPARLPAPLTLCSRPSPASCMTADPWRSIVDAGVCTGLAWGAASIVIIYARALAGTPPGVDPCLPSSS